MTARPWLPWFLSALISIGIFVYLFSQIEPAELLEAARGVAPRPLAWFAALVIVGVAARAVRYWILLGRAVSLKILVAITLARNLFVDLLPARTGELSYVYLVTRRAGRPLEEAVASLLLAMLYDVVALVPLLVLALIVVGGGAAMSTGTLLAASLLLAAAACAAIRLAEPAARRAAELVERRAPVRGPRLGAKLRTLADSIAQNRNRRTVLPVLGVSMAVRICKFGSYYFLVVAILAPLGDAVGGNGIFRVFLGAVGAELSAALPIHGIAGFGTFEAAWAASFVQLGFSWEHAIISGILAHAMSQVFEYSMGAVALLWLTRQR